jgi:CO/xanthine dehydrogenase FAD-binding subunit
MSGPVYIVARDPAEAIAARRAFGSAARYIAGGTALQLAWPDGRADHALIDVTALDMGPAVSIVSGERLRLAATVTLETLRRDARVKDAVPVLATALASIGALGVRHLATVGGNLAWGAGDLVPLLLVLDARVITGAADSLPVADWLGRRDDDLILAIDIPLPVPRLVMWEKIGRREAFCPSLITVAGALAADGLRLAVGGGAVPPARLSPVLRDEGDFERLASTLATDISAPDDSAASGRYRARAAGRVLASFAIEARR